jgi:AcrR family transcriptional regulator
MNAATPGVLPPARERLLLITAAGEFARAGYERASLNTIIRNCGMSKSSFYHYFASKQALFEHVMTEAGKALLDELQVPAPGELGGDRFWERVAALLARLLAISAQQAWYIDAGKLFHLPDAPAAQSPALQRALIHSAQWLDEALAVGRECGAVRDDLPAPLQGELVFAVLQAMDRWSLQHKDAMDATAWQRLADLQLDAVRRLLAP